jgi:glycine cleavage system H protein
MAVALLLVTFLVFVMIDVVMNYRRAPKVARQAVPAATPAAFLQPSVVDGFQVPAELRYHLGHTWLYRERKNVARIGVDEFGAALAGHIESLELPRPGTWIRQGQKAWTLVRNGERVEMVSPTEGEITEINQEVLANPALLRTDPYGKGWLLTVHVPDEESTTRNLLPKNMVAAWMRQSVEKLYALQPQLAGLAAADGGRPVGDLLEGVENADWKTIASDFFLTS